MAVSVTLTDAGIDVRISGMDAVWSMRGEVTVPWSEIVGALWSTRRPPRSG